MGVSENVMYPFLANGFADQTIPFLNGYFIGNIPHFQTNPNISSLFDMFIYDYICLYCIAVMMIHH